MAEKGYVYFMTNKTNAVLYIGVTSDLQKRVSQHKHHLHEGFTDKYNCTKLVYFEECNDIKAAIAREKQLKNWHREWKNNLVSKFNKDWKDLAEEEPLKQGDSDIRQNDMEPLKQGDSDIRQNDMETLKRVQGDKERHSDGECHSELVSESTGESNV